MVLFTEGGLRQPHGQIQLRLRHHGSIEAEHTRPRRDQFTDSLALGPSHDRKLALYRDILERYDRSHTFFYLDPPYYGMKVYRLNFEPKDFEALAQALGRVKGKFIMSRAPSRDVVA